MTFLAFAGTGPKHGTYLIKKTQPRHNTKGNSMKLEWWVYTTGDGDAYINFNSTLYIHKPKQDTRIYLGTFLPKTAGARVSYDTGFCNVMYNATS